MICYYFYKNVTFGFTIFLYEAYTSFSGQPAYNDWFLSLYNVFFTLLPVIALGVFDQDVSARFCIKETQKFRTHLLKKLSKKDMFGETVGICTEIFNDFLHMEHGGPETLLAILFIDMADILNERSLPGVLKLHEQLLSGLKITSTRTGKRGLAARVVQRRMFNISHRKSGRGAL
ncbi:Phospholipid-transporting ATPase [Forsythia ovata]|uniref:Phospholipid-transporting ATPase n=1 Tax=Forsythia ovata TaxID=205694 RepID=A0ABD1WSF7_9LAMI